MVSIEEGQVQQDNYSRGSIQYVQSRGSFIASKIDFRGYFRSLYRSSQCQYKSIKEYRIALDIRLESSIIELYVLKNTLSISISLLIFSQLYSSILVALNNQVNILKEVNRVLKLAIQIMRSNQVIHIQDFSNKRGVLFLNRFIRKASRNINEVFGLGRVTNEIT